MKSVFRIREMDCSAEEQIVRLKLEDHPCVQALAFDLEKRHVTVFHSANPQEISERIRELNFGVELVEHAQAQTAQVTDRSEEARILWYVLLINAFCFLLELITGFISHSMGLVADSLDMLADAFVYGLSLYAVGKAASTKKNVARWSGYLQLVLAVIGFSEVVRRFLYFEAMPQFTLMILSSLIALSGNAVSLWLLQKTRSDDAHIRASMIFTSNDVIINIGVIVAAVLVLVLESNKPDLIIGSIVFLIVIRGAARILRLSKA